MLRQITAFAALPLLASCVGPRDATPVPVPAPAPRPSPAPTPTAVADRYAGDWSVADLGPGDWSYTRSDTASAARLNTGGELAQAMLRCDSGIVTIAREGTVAAGAPAFLNVRTSFAERQLPVRIHPSAPRMLSASLPASDPLWDQILYSRGRFVIEATRNAPMIVPTRAELARVVEDCRS